MSEPKQLGRFEVGAVLGRGGMGVVYEGLDPQLGRRVALKTLPVHQMSSELEQQLETRLRREAIAAAKLSHPNIVTIFEVGETDGLLFIAMEFLDGKPFDKLLEERTELIVAQVDLMVPVSDALSALHQVGIIHRDLKPANIVVLPDGTPKLVDFGIAKDLSDGITRTGTVMGTPTYMSPEQLLGNEVDARSDIYAVGVILYEIVSGHRPFTGNQVAILAQILHGKRIPPSTHNPDVPAFLEAIIDKALALEPDERFQSAAEVSAALEDALEEIGTPTRTKRRPLSKFFKADAETKYDGGETSFGTETELAEPTNFADPAETDDLTFEPAEPVPPSQPQAPPAALPAEPNSAEATLLEAPPTPAATSRKSGLSISIFATLGLIAAAVAGAAFYVIDRDPARSAAPTDAPVVEPPPTVAPRVVRFLVDPGWIGGTLTLDGVPFEITGTEVVVPEGRYNEAEFNKPCKDWTGFDLPGDAGGVVDLTGTPAVDDTESEGCS